MSPFLDLAQVARFDPARMSKVDLVRGEQMFLGLNCLEPGQSQAIHHHAGADKFYLVLRGRVRVTIGGETRELGPGMVAWAPANLVHGVEAALERTVLLVGMSPPPGKAG